MPEASINARKSAEAYGELGRLLSRLLGEHRERKFSAGLMMIAAPDLPLPYVETAPRRYISSDNGTGNTPRGGASGGTSKCPDRRAQSKTSDDRCFPGFIAAAAVNHRKQRTPSVVIHSQVRAAGKILNIFLVVAL